MYTKKEVAQILTDILGINVLEQNVKAYKASIIEANSDTQIGSVSEKNNTVFFGKLIICVNATTTGTGRNYYIATGINGETLFQYGALNAADNFTINHIIEDAYFSRLYQATTQNLLGSTYFVGWKISVQS